MSANKLSAHWMPFTANKSFKEKPRMLSAAKGMYWTTDDQRQVLDMTAGLWCCNAGHAHPHIAEAIAKQARTLDYAPSFGFGHELSFELADRLASLAPGNLNRVFYTNSGSESVDTALKMALAYHYAKGNIGKQMFISREKGYHGVNFGGVSVAGLTNNHKAFGQWLPNDRLNHTQDLALNSFAHGLPLHGGVEKANELEDLIQRHDTSRIAAVIIEPITGAGGVLPPPVGYLKRIREICDKHDILLIFDEVITGFGRTGDVFASQTFDVIPDIMTTAKGLTNGAAPMGAVLAGDHIYDAIANNSSAGVEFFHGYTYSAHPLACAAAMATLDVYEQEDLYKRGAANGEISKYFEQGLHSLKGLPGVIDIRNYSFIAAVEFEPLAGKPGATGSLVQTSSWEQGLMLRSLGDAIAMSPPLIMEKEHVDQTIGTLERSIKQHFG
ncbi:aminotransferase class III-fold pyridoxal phosphate-dependent enzyme [Oceanisphaera pacifica]|uniref:Aminotransferase class III-fold pyridoxal phosphate-dependent enzyme n=1 Tax=Oceanisphaera pacifica TaxID=2818389 RepID=A0ABS3NIX2_9GAMM|nr:aminotransferase class III-fold pyridoxal phosphate-dependent enzyme [Oceanisphaera pacifica]MBO1520539.1 aminotransferase class III-fold pyridoxal phosphate-dependent enzyme [Oceanisphaera pacifica]